MKKSLLTLSLAGLVAATLSSCDKAPPGMAISGGGPSTKVTVDAPATGATTGLPPVPAKSTETVIAKAPDAVKPVATPVEAVKPMPAPAPTPAPAAPSATPAPTPPAVSGPSIKIAPKMPEPLFAGTPLPADNNIPNMDKPGTPAVLNGDAPEGTVLLSAKAKVTSSTPAPFVGGLEMVTDGDKDGSDGFFVELDPGKQWVQIDLGATHDLWGMWVWHFHKSNVVYKGVVAQASDDPEFKTGVTTLYNNDFDNSLGLGVGTDNSYVETNNGRFIPGKGSKARYVRLWSNGRYIDEMNHYIEVEIYGK